MVFLVFLYFVLRNRKKIERRNKETEEKENYTGRKINISLLLEKQCLKKRLLSG
jgi:hypothetical protein